MLQVCLRLQKPQLQAAFEHLNGHRGRKDTKWRGGPKEESTIADIV